MRDFYEVVGYNALGGGDDGKGTFRLGITGDIAEAYGLCEGFVNGYPEIRSTEVRRWRAETPEQVVLTAATNHYAGALCEGRVS